MKGSWNKTIKDMLQVVKKLSCPGIKTGKKKHLVRKVSLIFLPTKEKGEEKEK